MSCVRTTSKTVRPCGTTLPPYNEDGVHAQVRLLLSNRARLERRVCCSPTGHDSRGGCVTLQRGTTRGAGVLLSNGARLEGRVCAHVVLNVQSALTVLVTAIDAHRRVFIVSLLCSTSSSLWYEAHTPISISLQSETTAPRANLYTLVSVPSGSLRSRTCLTGAI